MSSLFKSRQKSNLECDREFKDKQIYSNDDGVVIQVPCIDIKNNQKFNS